MRRSIRYRRSLVRTRCFSRLVFGCAAAFSAATGCAETNGLDQTFGSNGFVALEPPPSTAVSFYPRGGLAIEADGKILIGGWAAGNEELGSHAAIGRLLADGSWDQGFGDHGIFMLPIPAAAAPDGGEIHNIVVLSDGAIVASGGAWVSASDYSTCTLLLKLSSTGEPVTSFGADDSGSFCFDFAPNPDAHTESRHNEGLLAAGDDSLYLTAPDTNLPTGAVAHFDSNGALIDAYGDHGVALLPGGALATRLQLTSDGKIVTLGGVPNPWEIAVARLDTAGEPDGDFGDSGLLTFDPQPNGLVSPSFGLLDAEQRLVIADNDEAGGLLPYRLARVTPTGTLDATFNGNSQQDGFPGFAALDLGASDYFNALQAAFPLADGHIFAVGDVGPMGASDGAYNLALLRLAADASFDDSFGDAAHPGWVSINIGGTATGTTRVRAMATDVAGRVFVIVDAGDGIQNGCTGLVRVITDRLLDAAFEEPPPLPSCPQ